MQFMAKQAPRHFSFYEDEADLWLPPPPPNPLPSPACSANGKMLCVCVLFPQALFSGNGGEWETNTRAHTRVCGKDGFYSPFFNHAKFLLLAELLVLFLKPYNFSQKRGKFQDWFVGKKKDPLPPSDQNRLKSEWFHCVMQSPLPLRSPYCKEGLNTTHKQTNKKKSQTWEWWIGKPNSSFNFVYDGCIQ